MSSTHWRRPGFLDASAVLFKELGLDLVHLLVHVVGSLRALVFGLVQLSQIEAVLLRVVLSDLRIDSKQVPLIFHLHLPWELDRSSKFLLEQPLGFRLFFTCQIRFVPC